jgi:hypothetical protein
LKRMPSGGVGEGDGMGWNSSHRGFFLDAITLQLFS